MRYLRHLAGMALLIGLPACGGSQSQPTPCSYTITPATQAVVSGGGALGATVNRSAGSCGWNASASAGWITVTTASGPASGTLAYTVAANSGDARSGTLTVTWTGGSAQVTVNQDAAPVIDVGPPVVGPP